MGPRFRDICLECRDFETGLIFSEMHHFLIDHSIPPNNGVGWRCGRKNCPVPSNVAGHKTVNAKGDRGISSKECEFVFSTTRTLIPFGNRNQLCKFLNSDYEWI